MLNLRWRDIGGDAINLPDSKTGPCAVPLGAAARTLIDAMPGERKPDGYLFPQYAEGRSTYSLISCWRAACEDAKLGRLRLHDLRHTTASQAVMWGESLPLVSKVLWASAAPNYGGLRPPCRRAPCRGGGESWSNRRRSDDVSTQLFIDVA